MKAAAITASPETGEWVLSHKYEEYVAAALLPTGQMKWLARVAGAPRPYGPHDKFGASTARFSSEAEARHAAEVLWKTDPGRDPIWKVYTCEIRVVS